MSDSGSVGNAHELAPTLQPLSETARVERICTLFHHVSVNEARLEREKEWTGRGGKKIYTIANTTTNQLSSGITRSLERKKKMKTRIVKTIFSNND